MCIRDRAFRFYLISCLLAVIVMVPFLWMLSTSLKSKGALMEIPIRWIPENPTMDAYRKVFSKFPFLRAIFNSLFITTSYTLITILSASMAAFAFTKIRFPGADGLLKLYLASMMIPTQVTLIPLFVIMNKLGLINTYPSVILPSLFRVFGIFMLVQQMRSIPKMCIRDRQRSGMWPPPQACPRLPCLMYSTERKKYQNRRKMQFLM